MNNSDTPRAAGYDPTIHSTARIAKGPWKDQISEARLLWRRLGEDELLRSDGQLGKLTRLVQERYELSRYTAESQVQGFLDRWKRNAATDGSTGK